MASEVPGPNAYPHAAGKDLGARNRKGCLMTWPLRRAGAATNGPGEKRTGLRRELVLER